MGEDYEYKCSPAGFKIQSPLAKEVNTFLISQQLPPTAHALNKSVCFKNFFKILTGILYMPPYQDYSDENKLHSVPQIPAPGYWN
jgi:hypothetical protein